MKISRNSERLRIILAMTLIFWAGSATANEQRCNDLGSVCTCNETLDTTTWQSDGSGSSLGGVIDLDPTGDGGTKICGQGFGTGNNLQISGDNPANIRTNLVPTVETGMPVGNSVNYVWRLARADRNLQLPGRALQASTRRFCFRHYLRLSPNHDGGSTINCSAGKFIHLGFDGNYQVGMSSGGCLGRSCEVGMFVVPSSVGAWDNAPGLTIDTGGNGNSFPFSGSLKYSDCYGQWCRMEMCVSGDFQTGRGDFFVEGKAARLSDGKTKTWPRFNMGAGKGSAMLNPQWVWDVVDGYAGYGYNGEGAGSCNPGHLPSERTNEWREYSHAMQAEWPIDLPGTFIGPAVEVEGTGSAPPPPPSAGEELGKPGTPAYQAQ